MDFKELMKAAMSIREQHMIAALECISNELAKDGDSDRKVAKIQKIIDDFVDPPQFQTGALPPWEINEDGTVKCFMPMVDGQHFHCEVCGANVFRKCEGIEQYICNSCDTVYAEEWPYPSTKAFREMASKRPESLRRWIETGKLQPGLLTFALEALADVPTSSEVVQLLLRHSEHESNVVREGAILGMEGHWCAEVEVRVRAMAESDPSPGVRSAAAEALFGLLEDKR